MIIHWDGKDYDYEHSGFTVDEMIPIQEYTEMGQRSWLAALSDFHPKALQCLLWLIKRRNGVFSDMSTLKFEIDEFVGAFNAAAAASEKGAKKKDRPKAGSSDQTSP